MASGPISNERFGRGTIYSGHSDLYRSREQNASFVSSIVDWQDSC